MQNNLHHYRISILVYFTHPKVHFMLTLVYLVKSDGLAQLTVSSKGRIPPSYASVKEIRVLVKSFEFKVHKLKTSLKKLQQERTWLFVSFVILKCVTTHSNSIVSKYSLTPLKSTQTCFPKRYFLEYL